MIPFIYSLMDNILKIFVILILLSSCSSKVTQTANSPASTQLKVMSYNIHHANPPSKPGLIDLDAIAEVIKRENPDLVGLQEVDQFTGRSGKLDQARLLAEKTGMYYLFFKAIDHDGGNYGVALLSKFPLKKAEKVDLPQVAKGEPRVLSYATVTLPNRTKLTLANTHLDATRPDSNRVAQMEKILEVLGTKKEATLLMGDLNCESHALPIKLLDKEFLRSCINGCGYTIPQVRPNKTIDYIALKNANWKVLSHTVIQEKYASDHLPIVVVYELK